MKGVAALLTLEVAAWEDVVNRVNSLGASWVAEAPARFQSVDDVVPLLGAFLPGDAQYEEPPVKEVSFTGDIPSSFDSAEQWSQCSVIANVRDQANCGTCWAFASVESFESRSCIATGKDIKYSPEDTGFCSNAGYGCQGGNSAWNWFKSSGVVTGGDYPDRDTGATCLPYSLKPCSHHVESQKYEPCPSSEYPSPSCARACSDGEYGKSYTSDKVHAKSAYSVRGVEQIQQEIMTNGPLYVAFTVYDDFPTYKSGVYHATSSNYLGGHAVLAVGWGTLDGQDYWKIKNSWNEQWGDEGHFLIRRGTNECGIESSVSGGLVDDSTAIVVEADNLVGTWEGSVPLIIDVKTTFDGSSTAAVSVDVKVAGVHIDCPSETIAETDTGVTFPNSAQVGDCVGDGVRTDNKDPSKYLLVKNSDGTLTFKSDGYPALKLKQKSTDVEV